MKFLGKTFSVSLILLVLADLISFWGHQFYSINLVFFIALVFVTVILGVWRLRYALLILTAELITGSFGYSFYVNLGDFKASIRLGLFLAIVLAYIYYYLINKKNNFFKSWLWKSSIIFIFFLILGIILGILNNNTYKNIFYDFNAYLYFCIIFVFFSLLKSWDDFLGHLQIILASSVFISIKTAGLLFFFAHTSDTYLIQTVYTWVRDTRFGEIASVFSNYFRIFSQSQIWSLFTALIIFFILFKFAVLLHKKEKYLLITIGGLSVLSLIIGFSRSLWLGGAITLILILIYLKITEKISWKKIIITLLYLFIVLVINLGLITIIVNIKLPGKAGSNVSIASLVKERIIETQEPAVISRYNLLLPLIKKIISSPLFGHGFGTNVEFVSDDPRTKLVNDGLYTTYSFEWGYLDILVKTGLLGFLAYGYFIFSIFKMGVQTLKQNGINLEKPVVIGLLFSIIALLIIHATTPYLNHPLGIFLLIISATVFNYTSKSQMRPETLN